MNRNKKSGFYVGPESALFIAVICVCSLAIAFWSVESSSFFHTVTLAYIAFMIGKILELRRIAENWRNVLGVSLAALLLSLIAFWPAKNERNYSLESRMDLWPLVFAAAFLVITILIYSKKLRSEIGEGINLIHSTAFMYYVLEMYQNDSVGPWLPLLILLPLCYSLLHALTKIKLKKGDRLFLSIWNSLIMFFFGGVYVFNVFKMDQIEALLAQERNWQAVYVFLEFFLLGASGPYIAYNASLILRYGFAFSSKPKHHKIVDKLNREHITRFSPVQIERLEALKCLFFVTTIFVTNFHLKIISPSFAVWISLILVPILVGVVSKNESPS